MKTFNLKILASNRDLYEGPCSGLTVPIYDGEYGVLPGHSSMLSTIVPGKVKAQIEDEDLIAFFNERNIKNIDLDSIKDDAGEKIVIVVEQGIITVKDNNVTIAVDSAEFIPEIDINRALKAQALAKEELLKKKSIVEYKLAMSAISRALNRIKSKK